MINLDGDISIPFLEKSRFTGSFQGMRYMLEKREGGGAQDSGPLDEAARAKTVLWAEIWPEPYNYEHTPGEKKHGREFVFEKEGLAEAIAWLNMEHEAGHY